ncbi:MAG TPA: type VI secretion system baseplate subunit TssK, partial [Planctomycetaceae bacterium]|nr:type VI secretion system baseplate subunit TssK [Planctomycetaceae bacterium]
ASVIDSMADYNSQSPESTGEFSCPANLIELIQAEPELSSGLSTNGAGNVGDSRCLSLHCRRRLFFSRSTTMGSDSLFWGDGLFLRPQHFQAIQRQSDDKLALTTRWGSPFYYGLKRFEYDQEALSNWRISLSQCHIRLQDGTQLRFPEDAHLSPVTIPQDAFSAMGDRVRIYIGLAELRRGVANTSRETSERTRYLAHEEEFVDENVAGNSEEIDIRKLNPQLLVGSEATQGFEALPIMQLKLGATAEAPPEIDTDYIPPLIANESWDPLTVFTRSVYDSLGATAEKFARQMNDRGVTFGSGHREDMERILHLHAVNTALGGLGHFPFTPGLHPFELYRELCRAVGALAIFRRQRRIPDMPYYDHDNIGPCLEKLRGMLALETEQQTDYVRVPFSSEGYQMTVRLEPEWLEPTWAFYIGVESELTTSRVGDLLTSERELGIKVGSTEQVDEIYRKGRRGVRIITVGESPRAFPRRNWHYFRVDRDGAWKDVERSLNFGLRFNDRRIEQQIQGENRINLIDRDSGNPVTLAFSLFAINHG